MQFILIVAVIMVFALVFIYYEFSLKVKNEFYSNLKSKAIMTADMVISSGLAIQKNNHVLDSIGDIPLYTENISVYNDENKRVYSFNPLPDDIPVNVLEQIKKSKDLRFEHKHYNALGMLYTNRQDAQYTIIAEAVFTSESLQFLQRILWIVFFILIALVAVSGWIFSGQALAPINHIMNQVDAILPANMNQRLSLSNQRDELSRLVDTFNNLLARIEKAFTNQKMFISHLSHELKNPISVIANQVEVTLQKERDKSEYIQTLKSILDDAKNLNDVTNNLMQLSRITLENNDVEFKSLRIDEMIWQAKEELLKNHPIYKIVVEVENLPEDENDLLIVGNESLLKTAFKNLMDNGCKYSPDKLVELRMKHEGKNAMMVDIENRGTGIANEDAAHIFKPFYRSPQHSAINGYGIGLSLVKQILELHKVKISVDQISGSKTRFRLIFDSAPLQKNALLN